MHKARKTKSGSPEKTGLAIVNVDLITPPGVNGNLQKPESDDIELGRPLETAAGSENNQTEDSRVVELENSFESYDGNVEDQGSDFKSYKEDDETEASDIQIPTYFKTYAQNGGSMKPNAPPQSYIQNQQPLSTLTD